MSCGGSRMPASPSTSGIDAAFDAITSAKRVGERTTALEEDRLNAYLKSGRALTLTDDFAPVDQLLARLFIERGN